MDHHVLCEICNEYKTRYLAVQPVLSSMGSRDSRREKAAKRMRVCRTCFNGPKFARLLMAVIRETGKAVASEARAVEGDK